MGYAAVLDANMLYPASLRDTLLRFAAAGFYDLLWSERILDEAERNLVADGRVDESGARRLRNAMTAAFDDAIVPTEAIAGLEGASPAASSGSTRFSSTAFVATMIELATRSGAAIRTLA